MEAMPQDTARLVTVVFERLARLLRGHQHTGGLNPAQWEALRYLANANRSSRRPGVLAEFLGSTRGTVSQTLIALERKGLVARRGGEKDGRRVALELTAAGWELLAEDPLGEFQRAAQSLDDADQKALLSGLMTLLRGVQSQSQASGVCQTCRYIARDADGDMPTGSHVCRITGELVEIESAPAKT